MVMEAPPSPQSVGREFVRQYYTLLNKAPTHLHRFYNNQSSFVHGGLDPPNRETSPVIGQKQIHQKIQQLNFRDCHAKITQVDAQATLGNGVVVQVTGELSNAGQPMRRFTQTFVLAAQSPKKYYVHNDIFRYQDEIVSDDECEPESRSEVEDELLPERQVLSDVTQIPQQPPITYYNPNSGPLQPNITPVPPHHGQPATALAHVMPTQPVATINGNLHPDELSAISTGQLSPSVPTVQGQTLGAPIGNLQSVIAPVEESKSATEEQPLNTALDNAYPINQDVMSLQEMNQESVLPNEPKTYATLLKSGTTGYTGVVPSATVYNQPPKSLSPPISQSHYDNRDLPVSQVGNQSSGSLGHRIGTNRGPRNNQQSRMPRQDSRSGKNSFTDDGPNTDDRRKLQNHRDASFGDSHQLFLGNLPHTATEEELREIFSAFGPIVDLRIQPSTKGSTSGLRAPPNYGFITYENQQAVQNCLAAKPIRYSDKNATVLNVEEKKTKDRLSYGGNRGGSDNMGGLRSRDNGSRRPGTARGGGGSVGGPGGRPNNFNRPPNRNSTNTYGNRR